MKDCSECSFQHTAPPKLVQRDLCNDEPGDCWGWCWEHSSHAHLCENTVSSMHQMLCVWFWFYILIICLIWDTGHTLDYSKLLIHLWCRIKIFMPTSCLRITGHQLHWSPLGSSRPTVPWHRCLPQRSQCYPWHMLSFKDSKKISRRSYKVFLLVFLPVSSRVSSTCTQDLVITIISMMNHPFILGWHVCHLSGSNWITLTVLW